MAPKKKSGSKVAPDRDGNTKSLSSATNPPKAARLHWILTMKWPHGSNGSYISALQQWCRANTERTSLQLEKGESGTNYEHMQITVTLKKKQKLNWFKNHMCTHVHCEEVRNTEASFNYCTKSDTRIWGPWHYPEPIQEGCKDPMEGKKFYEWQKDVLDIINLPPDGRTIHWYWEPDGGVGKTNFAKHLVLKKEALFCQGKKNDIAFTYKGQKIVIFGFSRSNEDHISYDAIEALCDGLVFSGKYESGVKCYDCPHVFVFANWPPNEEALSKDRWRIRKIAPEGAHPVAPKGAPPGSLRSRKWGSLSLHATRFIKDP